MNTITEEIKAFKGAVACLGGCLGAFVGGFDGLLYALLIFVIIDYVTGLGVAIINKKLSSEVGFRGIFKKILIFAIVGLAHLLDAEVLKVGDTLRTACIFFYLANEGISILENASKIGLPVPKKIRAVLDQLKEESEETEDAEEETEEIEVLEEEGEEPTPNDDENDN